MLTDNEFIRNNFIFTILENGSLTKAARELKISQPALSMKLGKLEESIGITLFNRDTSPITLTAEGRIYVDYLKKQKVIMDEFEASVDLLHNELAHRVTIGGPDVYVNSLVVGAVKKLREQDPDCMVEILNGSQQALISLAEAGTLDFFICTSNRLPEVFETVPLNRERLYLCLSASLPINKKLQKYMTGPGGHGRCFDFSMLNGYPFIFLGEKQPLQKNIERFLEEYGITPVSRARVNQVATGLELVAAGEGVFMASAAAIRSCASKIDICTYALPESYTDRQIYAAYNRHHELSESSLKMLSLLKEEQ
ncbi:MAG: LysR family transcriptional regulator [Lachnospiraceae bacterium]|nr:LysR family transcriptional regulator [Lachnospiraceae bacterium]